MLLTVCVALSACSAAARVQVTVRPSGKGSVAVSVSFDKAAVAQIEDLKAGLPVADLRAAGWSVSGPVRKADGSAVLNASHGFTDLSQIPVLLADIAGSGPIASRPFRLQVSESSGLLTNSFVASGQVDLRCWLSCFDDPKLAKDVGYPLGLPHAELVKLLGAHPGDHIALSFELTLPGHLSRSDAQSRAGGGYLLWSTPLGNSTPLSAVTSSLDVAHAIELAVAGVAIVVALAGAALLLSSRRRQGQELEPEPLDVSRHRRR